MKDLLVQLRIWRERRGQDLIEYALMAGFVAVASGVVIPSVATNFIQIFSRVNSVLSSIGGS